jgi:Xaa-Pro aminopeptidase
MNRIEKLRDLIKSDGYDGLFITNQDNIKYLTGFSGLSENEREAFLLVTLKNAFLLTFPTYFEMLDNKIPGIKVLNITYNRKMHAHLCFIAETESLKNIVFESDNMTLSEFESLKNKTALKFIPADKYPEKLRLYKDDGEIKSLMDASKISDDAYNFILTEIKTGISEKELALRLEFFIKNKAETTAFNPIVAFGRNTSIPHHLPLAQTKLKRNTHVLIDFGVKINGYCSDMTRIVFFGQPDNKIVDIYKTVLNAQKNAIRKLKVGTNAMDIDIATREEIKQRGYPEFLHGLGHGTGLSIHENPRLRPNSKDILLENMVFTIEPGIYLSNQYGIRIEDLVVLRKDGPEILTKTTKEIVVIS